MPSRPGSLLPTASTAAEVRQPATRMFAANRRVSAPGRDERGGDAVDALAHGPGRHVSSASRVGTRNRSAARRRPVAGVAEAGEQDAGDRRAGSTGGWASRIRIVARPRDARGAAEVPRSTAKGPGQAARIASSSGPNRSSISRRQRGIARRVVRVAEVEREVPEAGAGEAPDRRRDLLRRAGQAALARQARSIDRRGPPSPTPSARASPGPGPPPRRPRSRSSPSRAMSADPASAMLTLIASPQRAATCAVLAPWPATQIGGPDARPPHGITWASSVCTSSPSNVTGSLAEHPGHHLDRLRVPGHGPRGVVAEGAPARVARRDAAAQAQDDAAAGHLVEGDRHLREQRGVAEPLAGDVRPDAHAGRRLRERRDDRPALPEPDPLAADLALEVVRHPQRVDAHRLGVAGRAPASRATWRSVRSARGQVGQVEPDGDGRRRPGHARILPDARRPGA